MTDDEFEQYLVDFSDDQVASLRNLRDLINQNAEGLEEFVNTGRWLNGFVFYAAFGQMIYAIGPKGKVKTTFHMMPYYGSPTLQARHGDTLSRFLTGRSCIAFRNYLELPLDALTDIILRGTPVMVEMMEARGHAERTRRTRSQQKPT